MRSGRKTFFSAPFAALAFFAAASISSAHSPQQQREVLEKVDFVQRLNSEVPTDLRFRDEEGRVLSLADRMADKPTILALGYYNCPQLCSMILNGLVESVTAVSLVPAEEYQILVVSIAPDEGPELARKRKDLYVSRHPRPEAERAWHFLTGGNDEIKRLADSVGFKYTRDPASGEYAHPSGIVVLTPDGHVSRYFMGIRYPARDLKFALVEASAGKIGTLADKLLLLCYHYDPLTGRYGVAIFRTLQILGVLTLLAIGAGIWALRRSSRKAGYG